MSTSAVRRTRFRTDEKEPSLRASSGLMAAIGSNVGTIETVREIRVLHRGENRSKFFVILDRASVTTVQRVVQIMVQIEEAFPDQHFDYDTVSAESVPLVPENAHPISLI